LNDRRYPTHPVPGVGAIVVGEKGVLLARRDKDPGEGLWSFPGGAVELGESLEEAIVREVREETNVDCEIVDLLTTADLITEDTLGRVEYHFILNHYLARALTDNIAPETPDGEVGWFHPEQLPSDMVNPRVTALILSERERIAEMMKDAGNTSE
jgi:ADP-ribose pyrophosphatase YjhB (NUDIX family)